MERRIRPILGDAIYGADETSLDAVALALLRSAGLTLGKSQYIITIPDGNHSRKTRHNETPSHRWTKIRLRWSI